MTTAIASSQSSTKPTELILDDVSVVDTHNGAVQSGVAVVINDGKIVRIEKQGATSGNRSARVINLHGKYVVPGFWEMHGHVVDGPNRANDLTLMLANGITGLRQMSGSADLLERRKTGTLMPASDTPELLAMPGSILLRSNAGNPEQAVQEVDRQKAEGADFIKTIDVSPSSFFAALNEAKKQGLPFDGHLSPGVDAVKASEQGMRGIEHLGSPELMLISCSSDEAAIRSATDQRLKSLQPMPQAPAASGKAGTWNPTLTRALGDPQAISRIQHVLDTFSEQKCKQMARVFVANNTWQIPTLIRLRTTEFGDDPSYKNDPNLEYVSPSVRQAWMGLGKEFAEKIPDRDQQTLEQTYALQLRLAKLLDDSGVKLLAGSDFGGIWLVAGFSLHQEFDQLAAAGFTPLRVLQMTTLNGAQFPGRETTDGSVETGKNANLVVLDANPMESVQNLHKIDAVVRGGRFYSKDDLEALKTQVRTRIAAMKVTDDSSGAGPDHLD